MYDCGGRSILRFESTSPTNRADCYRCETCSASYLHYCSGPLEACGLARWTPGYGVGEFHCGACQVGQTGRLGKKGFRCEVRPGLW